MDKDFICPMCDKECENLTILMNYISEHKETEKDNKAEQEKTNVPKLKQTFDIEYKIFQDGRTIVCYVTPKNYIPFLRFSVDTTEERINVFESRTLHFKGIARLKEGDNLDVEIGKKIAKKKAMRSYFRYLKRKYFSFFKKMLNIINQRIAFISQIDKRIEILTNEIKELTK